MDNITYDDKAKIMYEKHLERMRNYSKNNREKTRDTAKKVYQKIKEDPEKYKLYLERRRNEYHARKQKKAIPLAVGGMVVQAKESKVICETDEVQAQIIENDENELEFKDFTIE